jgi:hypothetical protein
MLKEYKTDRVHFFKDDIGRYQGECKSWYDNGQLREHCFWLNGRRQGEYNWWYEDGTFLSHVFYVDGEVYRDLLANPVTEEDKFIIALETGGGWLC